MGRDPWRGRPRAARLRPPFGPAPLLCTTNEEDHPQHRPEKLPAKEPYLHFRSLRLHPPTDHLPHGPASHSNHLCTSLQSHHGGPSSPRPTADSDPRDRLPGGLLQDANLGFHAGRVFPREVWGGGQRQGKKRRSIPRGIERLRLEALRNAANPVTDPMETLAAGLGNPEHDPMVDSGAVAHVASLPGDPGR